MDLKLERLRSRDGPYNRKVLEDKSLEDGEEYEYIPIEHVEPVPHFMPNRSELPTVATLVENIKKLFTEYLRQV